MIFSVVKADIVNLDVDAVVLPANEQLREGSGTSRAIFKGAGRIALTKACKEIGHCNIGSAVPTLGYNLKSKYIIHAVVPSWVDGEHGEYDLLSSAYLASLKVAEIMHCDSIAFPLLAAGNNGFDKELAIQIAKESINQFTGDNLKNIYLVVFEGSVEILMRMQGFDVTVPSEQFAINEQKAKKRAKFQQLFAVGNDVAQKALEAQVNKALEWLKDEQNQQKLFNWGIAIAQVVLMKKAPKRNK